MKNSGVAALLMFSFILLRGPEELLEFVLVVVIPGVYMIGIFLLEWSVSNRKAVYKEPVAVARLGRIMRCTNTGQ